jgi:hypothetical protein
MKFYLFRIRLNKGGHDRTGKCDLLYHYMEIDLVHWLPSSGYIRAQDREDAKRIIRDKYPNAKFFR